MFFFFIENGLKCQESCFVLNGYVSRWAALNAWVPQGSILGPLFIIYLFI